MAHQRCSSCSGIVTESETHCYVCGEAVPGRSTSFLSWLFSKPPNPAARRAADRVLRNDVANTEDCNERDF